MSIEWDGNGIPPVGCVCEARVSSHQPGFDCWRKVKVVFTGNPGSEREALVFDIRTTKPAWVDEFRPIITEAKRRRIETVQIMCNVLGNGIQCDENAGYGKAWFNAYDAIAAGKIPGIRLTDESSD